MNRRIDDGCLSLRAVAPDSRGMGLPAFSTTWPLPRGHYFGLISGPAASRGGFTADEKIWVREIQRQLIRKGYVPGVEDPNSGWADGLFEKPTADAVARFQRREMPGTRFFGQVRADDFAELFATNTQAPSPRRDRPEEDRDDSRVSEHDRHDRLSPHDRA